MQNYEGIISLEGNLCQMLLTLTYVYDYISNNITVLTKLTVHCEAFMTCSENYLLYTIPMCPWETSLQICSSLAMTFVRLKAMLLSIDI